MRVYEQSNVKEYQIFCETITLFMSKSSENTFQVSINKLFIEPLVYISLLLSTQHFCSLKIWKTFLN